MKMKAIVCTKYRSPDVLQLTEVETPTPKDNEVLMKVYAASLKGDWHILRGEPLLRLTTGGLLKPKHKILGDDIAGRVEAVGRNVTQFQPSDEVFGISNFGAFAEYRCVPSARANIRVAQALDRLPLKEISLPDDVAQAWKGKVKGKN